MKLLQVIIAVAAAFSGLAAGQEMPAFSADVRVVEVYATVADSRGCYIDGLQRDQFTVRDNGELQPISQFEAVSTDIVCAILIDTTGSTAPALPVLKSPVIHLIDDLPPSSRIAVYAFSHALEEIQDFTTDKKSAKQRVLRVRAQGETALFDAIVQTAMRLALQEWEEVPGAIHRRRRQCERAGCAGCDREMQTGWRPGLCRRSRGGGSKPSALQATA